ncbi:MAG: dihydrolipoamide acetyltransferase family protein [Prosthecobacter sp.]|uniref:dihydrolipoamide acetyltransferase family protein n=1 Tax=Prosthecobacter sp. TaxID=1965333 RepID=UPI0038FF7C6A
MPINITLPRLGWSMEEGKFLAWLKQDGDFIKEGEPLFTLESDKAAQEVEAIDSGILRIPLDGPQPGDVIKVGHVLGYLLAEGESAPVSRQPEEKADESGPKNLIHSPAPILLPTKSRTETPASPRARRAAKAHQVELSTLGPTGKGGRIRERDVLAASTKPMPTSMREVPITTMRRTIATRMVNSLNNTAPVTITCRCDATQIVTLRGQLKAAGASALPSYTDIIAKITASALIAHPLLTARWDTDRLLMPEQIHIGIAVDTDAGLLVPVLRDVGTSSLTAIASQSRQLIEAARAGRLSTSDMQGGCFTITNLGNFGIEAFTPIINFPETAILGLGAIIREPVALDDGTLTSRQQMALSLTFDHRILDGAPAARFLQTLRQRIEEPFAWLI